MKFTPNTRDYEKSPYTGLTRGSWIEAGEYLLQGIFQHIKRFEDPVVMPRKETKITYPHLDAPESQQRTQKLAEMFEGLTRSFFIAAPLIKNKPELTICGYRLADYYKNQVIRSCTRGDEIYIGTYEDQQNITGYADPNRAFQQTVETCALVICLWVSRNAIWDTCTKEQKDIIAEFLSSYAHANTVPQNWRLFNMLDLAFLSMEGYPIDEDIMRDHAQAILAYYAGDGWYRDGHSFDYYSCWAFQVYAPIWNVWYGYEKEPYLAAQFEAQSNKLMETYPDFFDRDGFTNMWGRSNIYRNASTSAFDANFFLKQPAADPGLARRICSGSLMQFLGREDFLYDGIPTLGFYGQFSPLVQGYSCAESPFWLGKAFLCLDLPADHPFWTARENNGTWELLKERECKVTCLDGPALCFSNHQANGETNLRTAKVVKQAGDEHGMWNYSKLCYNTKYPWESSPSPEVEAQQYVLTDAQNGRRTKKFFVPFLKHLWHTDAQNGRRTKANVTFWQGQKDGVLYRRQFFNYTLSAECHWMQAVNLADVAVPYGILRVDKLRLFQRPIELTLGAFGFPDQGTEITYREKGTAKAVILKGKDATGAPRQLAMTIFAGWDKVAVLRSTGTNPDSEHSIIAYAATSRTKQYGYEPYLLISQVITKSEHDDFAEEDLFPIEAISCTDPQQCGGYGPVVLTMSDGTKKKIDFAALEGNMQL